ncbi:CRISPR-associated protein Csb3 [Geodermatophilus africanus]|uniref:CRISPR-associated protein Csb3 n=1 Tax=Geodermatophilus africanus TaxID=1137993 RepID=A0A1H3G5C4_9ACTN|nr:hypothetical protein [Geodermatophilus africanus]SDX98237.1 CRISPR-associated protein Csb3 [Geodermatophilus africanus]
MTAEAQTELAPTKHDVLFTHAVLWGAASIAATVHKGVRLGWTRGLSPTAIVYGIAPNELAAAVRQRALRSIEPSHWIQTAQPHDRTRALFSPRIKALPDAAAWTAMRLVREEQVDRLAGQRATLDLRLLSALGEPSWWHHNRGKPRQDDSASRLEMQPRNQGSEFVGTLLRKLAAAVAARSEAEVAAGLTGVTRTDEAGKDEPGSRSAGNLRPPGPTDNALAWVAMWGLASVPVAHQIHTPSHTAAYLASSRNTQVHEDRKADHVVVPLWTDRWTVGRLRGVLASRALTGRGHAALFDNVGCAKAQHDEVWLLQQGVRALVLLPVGTFGSGSAPERRVLPGRVARLGVTLGPPSS